jgi:methylisocitrate lyase
MVIWPVSALRVAAKAQEELYDSIRAHGGAHKMVERMQTRGELYAALGYPEYEDLDSSIAKTILPTPFPDNR